MRENNNKIYDAVQLVFVIILFITAAYFTKNILFNDVKDASKIPNKITTPREEIPDLNGTGGLPPIDTKTISLIGEEYQIDQDITREDFVQLALYGDFEVAQLNIQGIIENNRANFVSLFFEDTSGTLGGFRDSTNTLNPVKTTNVYIDETDISISINLKNDISLSTTQREFNQGLGSQKIVNLWEKIEPPVDRGSIVDFYIAPYDDQGYYGKGSSITKIEFEYACKDGSSCYASLCPKNEKDTVCLEEFEEGASLQLQKYLENNQSN